MTTPHPPAPPPIGPEVARHVLWHFREPGGIEPGSFTRLLVAAMAAADPRNLRRFAPGFPDYTAAMTLAQSDPAGIPALQDLAGVRLCGDCSGTGLRGDGPPVVGTDGEVRYLTPCGTCRGIGEV